MNRYIQSPTGISESLKYGTLAGKVRPYTMSALKLALRPNGSVPIQGTAGEFGFSCLSSLNSRP